MLEVTDQTIHLLFKHPTFINYLNEQINQNVQSTAEFENYTQFSLKRLAREVNDRIFHHLRQQISDVSKDLEEALVAKTQAQLEEIRKEVQSLKKELNLDMEQFKNRNLNPENQTSLVGTFPIQMTDVETKKETKKDLLQNRRTLADSLLELSCILGKQKILDLQPQSELSQHNISQNKLTELENLTFIKGKVVEFEADYSNLLKKINQWHIEKKENIEQNYLLRQNIEERLETHFQGLWKVVSNLQIKFIKYEQILHQKGIV